MKKAKVASCVPKRIRQKIINRRLNINSAVYWPMVSPFGHWRFDVINSVLASPSRYDRSTFGRFPQSVQYRYLQPTQPSVLQACCKTSFLFSYLTAKQYKLKFHQAHHDTSCVLGYALDMCRHFQAHTPSRPSPIIVIFHRELATRFRLPSLWTAYITTFFSNNIRVVIWA